MIDGQPERAIVNPFTGADGKIDEFCTAFANLREDFRTKASIHITLVQGQIELTLGRMELVQFQMASSLDLTREYNPFSHLTLFYDFPPSM